MFSIRLAPHLFLCSIAIGITENTEPLIYHYGFDGVVAIYTPIDKDVEEDAKLNDQILAGIQLKRWGRPEEVAEFEVYLALDFASYVTGNTHFINGGELRNAGSL